MFKANPSCDHTKPADACMSAQGNRRYVKCLYVFNKIDVCSMEEVDAIARQPDSIPLSCTQRLNLDTLLEMLWDMMGLVSRWETCCLGQ